MDKGSVHPWISLSLIAGPCVSICGLSTLSNALEVSWQHPLLPENLTCFCPYRGLNQQPSEWTTATQYKILSRCLILLQFSLAIFLTHDLSESCVPVHLHDSYLTLCASGHNGSSIPSKGSLCGRTKLGTWSFLMRLYRKEELLLSRWKSEIASCN